MARTNPDVERLTAENDRLRKDIARMRSDPGEMPVDGCGDGSCIIRRQVGMHTNGGCRCDEHRLRRAVMWQRLRMIYLEQCVGMVRFELGKESDARDIAETEVARLSALLDGEVSS